MTASLDNGDRRTIRITFRNAAAALADPTDVTLTVKPPRRAASTYRYSLAEITRASLGVYEKAITFDKPGRWILKAEGTGAIAATTPASEVNVSHDRLAA